MKLNTDRIVAISAMIVGISGVLIAVYQSLLMRESQHASVMPYLTIGLNSGADGSNVVLGNVGIGPALIEDLRIRFQGREITDDPYQFLLTQYPRRGDDPLTVENVRPGQLLPAGASRSLVGLNRFDGSFFNDLLRLFALSEVPKSWLETAHATDTPKAVIVVTYASVYGERWRIASDSAVPERVK